VVEAGMGLPGGDFRQMPEYLVAWELEVWKKVGWCWGGSGAAAAGCW
jgi:hypothetical protein